MYKIGFLVNIYVDRIIMRIRRAEAYVPSTEFSIYNTPIEFRTKHFQSTSYILL